MSERVTRQLDKQTMLGETPVFHKQRYLPLQTAPPRFASRSNGMSSLHTQFRTVDPGRIGRRVARGIVHDMVSNDQLVSPPLSPPVFTEVMV
jgi:hypothetical protein